MIEKNRRLPISAAFFLVVAAAAPASADAGSAFEDRATAQIEALQAVKRSLSPAEQKIDSKLTVAGRRNERSPAAGTVLVDVRAERWSESLLTAIRGAGGRIRSASPDHPVVRAEIAAARLGELADRADVAGIRLALEGRTQSVVTEADKVHNAELARNTFGVTGAGMKICAMSNGVDSLARSQAAGELPAVDVLEGQAGVDDEGTAILEIIHDLAPEAELGFATAIGEQGEHASNIRKLRFERGCDVLVDDVVHFDAPTFQDGVVARAVDAVAADGALYFSSAGNFGNVADGTSAHWEGWFNRVAGGRHDFDPSPRVTQAVNPLSDHSGHSLLTLNWSDPAGRSGNDYDLYLLDQAGNVVAYSQDVQTGGQDPFEAIQVPEKSAGTRVAVVKYRGADRYLSLTAYFGRFADSPDGARKFVSPGVIFGHAAAKGAIAVAAAPAGEALNADLHPGDPANPAGPHPAAYDRTQKPERFTSDGPRRLFFTANGLPRDDVRQVPEITAADGVATTIAAHNPFFGTSASAPHAAAIAGLVWSARPGLTAKEVRKALSVSAIDIAGPGRDGRTGAGVVMVDRAIAHVLSRSS